MMQLTLIKRVVLSISALLVLMFMIYLIAQNRVGLIDKDLTEIAQGAQLKQRYAINFRGSVHDRAISIRDAILVDNDKDLNKHLNEIKTLADFYQQSAEPMNQMMLAPSAQPEEKQLKTAIDEIERTTLALSKQVIDYRVAGDTEKARQLLIQDVSPAYSEWLKRINAFINYQEAIIKQKAGNAAAVAGSFSSVVMIIFLVALVIGGVIAASLVRYINNTLGADPSDIKQYMLKLAQGQLNFMLPNERPAGSVIDAIHATQDNMNQAITEVNAVLVSLAEGRFDQRLNKAYQGDLETLRQGVNNSVEQVSFMMNELSKVMNALKNAHFTQEINTLAPGNYGVTLNSAADAMLSIHAIIDEIILVMNKMSVGDFSTRVQVAAPGDLNKLKQHINDSMDNLMEVVNLMTEVVGAQASGDLTATLKSGVFKGQLHDLKNAINFSSEKMKEVVDEAVTTAHVVTSAATQVSEGAAQLSSRVQQQASALEQTSATMNEMASAVEANTQSARKVAELTQHVQQQSVQGLSVMHETIHAMQSIRESSGKIADIVTLIDGIAFQTNLLALNAAVEAARAGEHGRGFAVVAGEVRSLAQKSAEAAKDIKTLISDSVSRVEVGTELVEKSGSMLSGISSSIESVAQMVVEISHASDEQLSGIDQVHKAISEIESVTQQNASLVDETTQAASSLSTEATSMMQSMGFFKTGRSEKPSVSTGSMAARSNKVSPRPIALPNHSRQQSDEWNEF